MSAAQRFGDDLVHQAQFEQVFGGNLQRLGCQIIVSEEMEGLTVSLPPATRWSGARAPPACSGRWYRR